MALMLDRQICSLWETPSKTSRGSSGSFSHTSTRTTVTLHTCHKAPQFPWVQYCGEETVIFVFSRCVFVGLSWLAGTAFLPRGKGFVGRHHCDCWEESDAWNPSVRRNTLAVNPADAWLCGRQLCTDEKEEIKPRVASADWYSDVRN